MEKLRQLHDAIKQHPYRINFERKYWPEYQKLLYDISHEAALEFRNIEYLRKHPPYGFIHDFNYAIMYGENIHIERCIGYIHRFIETGRFDKYATWYTGSNILKSGSRVRVYNYHEDIERWIPEMKKSQLDAMIKEIEDYWAEHGKTSILYSDSYHDYLTELRDKYSDKLLDG